VHLNAIMLKSASGFVGERKATCDFAAHGAKMRKASEGEDGVAVFVGPAAEGLVAGRAGRHELEVGSESVSAFMAEEAWLV